MNNLQSDSWKKKQFRILYNLATHTELMNIFRILWKYRWKIQSNKDMQFHIEILDQCPQNIFQVLNSKIKRQIPMNCVGTTESYKQCYLLGGNVQLYVPSQFIFKCNAQI
jgi:hypothetical protein